MLKIHRDRITERQDRVTKRQDSKTKVQRTMAEIILTGICDTKRRGDVNITENNVK